MTTTIGMTLDVEDVVWCFWEPKDRMYDYLGLCLETWQKLGRKMVVLDDSNLLQYLSKKEIKILKANRHYYTLPQYADAVRVMILRRYGGIWMDVDTIVIHPEKFELIEQLKNKTELLMIDHHIGWIWASRGGWVIKLWYKELIKKIDFEKYKIGRDGVLRKYWRKAKLTKYKLRRQPSKAQALLDYINEPRIGWDYLGNSIVNSLIDNTEEAQYRSLTEIAPYHTFIPESSTWQKKYKDDPDQPKKYADFYFSDAMSLRAFDKSIFVCLHNSWTPEEYKSMGREQFLHSNTLIARLLSKKLHII